MGSGKWSRVAALVVCGLAVTGCGAIYTATAGRKLDVQTKMSSSIFLEPMPSQRRTIWVEVRNTSDKPDLDLASRVKQALIARGYQLAGDPRDADLILQATVLQAGASTRTAADREFGSGHGSALAGGAVGGLAGYGTGRARGGDAGVLAVGGALAGAALGEIGDAFVQDVAYTVLADVQVAQRAAGGQIVTRSTSALLSQGTAGADTETSATTSGWRRYRTRVTGTARRANLDWPEAAPALADGLSRSITGIF